MSHALTQSLAQPLTRIDLPALIRLQLDARSLSLPKLHRAAAQQQGQHASSIRGRGMAFAEVRLYQPGDDIRTIDWRVTARRQKPHTKRFEEERERPLLLVCDQSSSLYFASEGAYKSVIAAQVTGLLAWLGLDQGDRVGGVVFSDHSLSIVRPMRRHSAVLRLLDHIARLQAGLNGPKMPPANEAGTPARPDSLAYPLNKALMETRRIAHTGSHLFIVSDFLHADATTERHLRQLAQHNQVTVIRIVDRFEKTLPPPGHYALSSQGKTRWFDTSNKAFREAFATKVQAHEQALQQMLTNARIPTIELMTRQSPVQALQRLLKQPVNTPMAHPTLSSGHNI